MKLPPLPTSLDRFTPTEIQSFALRAIVTQYGQQCAQAALEQVRVALDAKAPEPKGLFIDLIAQHEGLAEELRDAPEPEPVAWRLGINLHHSLKDAEWEWRHGETYSNTSYAPEPLYLHPPAAHQPLTLAQVDDLLKNWYPVADYLEHIELVRAIKAAVRAKQ